MSVSLWQPLTPSLRSSARHDIHPRGSYEGQSAAFIQCAVCVHPELSCKQFYFKSPQNCSQTNAFCCISKYMHSHLLHAMQEEGYLISRYSLQKP